MPSSVDHAVWDVQILALVAPVVGARLPLTVARCHKNCMQHCCNFRQQERISLLLSLVRHVHASSCTSVILGRLLPTYCMLLTTSIVQSALSFSKPSQTCELDSLQKKFCAYSSASSCSHHIRLHRWEQQHLLDIVMIREQHRHSVNAHSPSASGRKPVF